MWRAAAAVVLTLALAGCWSLAFDLEYRPTAEGARADGGAPSRDATTDQGTASVPDDDDVVGDSGDASPLTPQGVMACGTTTCMTPAQACCLDWQQNDRCVDGAQATCSSLGAGPTELGRCDRSSQCAPGLVCCGIQAPAPHPFRSSCMTTADCASASGSEACNGGAPCPPSQGCTPVTDSAYSVCK